MVAITSYDDVQGRITVHIRDRELSGIVKRLVEPHIGFPGLPGVQDDGDEVPAETAAHGQNEIDVRI